MNKAGLRLNLLWLAVVMAACTTTSFGQWVTVDIGQQKVCKLAGIVLDPSGAVIAGATMKVIDGSGREWIRKTDGDGRFHFDGFASGDYKFEVTSLGFNTNGWNSRSA